MNTIYWKRKSVACSVSQRIISWVLLNPLKQFHTAPNTQGTFTTNQSLINVVSWIHLYFFFLFGYKYSRKCANYLYCSWVKTLRTDGSHENQTDDHDKPTRTRFADWERSNSRMRYHRSLTRQTANTRAPILSRDSAVLWWEIWPFFFHGLDKNKSSNKPHVLTIIKKKSIVTDQKKRTHTVHLLFYLH